MQDARDSRRHPVSVEPLWSPFGFALVTRRTATRTRTALTHPALTHPALTRPVLTRLALTHRPEFVTRCRPIS